MMKLVVKASVSEAESKDYDYIFDQPVVTIGRLKENDIQLPLSTVSGFHAQILKEGDAFYLLDRGSVNGTFLNGQRLAGGEKKLITDGDTIRIQSFEIYFSTGPGMQIEQGATVQVARQMVMEVLGSWESQSQERPRLIVMGGVDNGKQVEMTEGKNILLGRSPECDVLIDHASISRKHAEITFNWSGAFVRDLSSPNGVYVNDVRIPGTRKLHDRDEIRLGQQTSTDPVRVVFSNPAEALLSKIEGAHITDTRDGVQSKVVTGSIQQQEIQAAAPVPSSSADQSRVEVAEQKEQKQPQAEQPVGKKSISLWILVGGAAVVTLLLIAFAVFVISNQRSVSISQVEPPEGEPGDIITLRGKNLDSTRIQNVTILARDAAVIRRDRTNLQIRVPAFPNLAASQRQTEIVLAEESAEIARVPFVLLVTPQVESISPVSGKPGMEVRIRATGGAGTPSVYFGPYKTEVKSSADREIIAIVPEPAESIPDSGLLLQVTVRFQDVASKNSVPFTLYAETVALPETEAFQLSFLARPYPVVLGFNEYAVETNIGPLLVVVAKDEYGSSSARAEAVAQNLNEAMEFFKANPGAKVNQSKQTGGISLYAEGDSPDQQRHLLRVFPEDALAYGKIKQRVVSVNDIADWWQMLLESYYRVFVQMQSPADTGILGAGGTILQQLYDFYSIRNDQGQKYYSKDFLGSLPADQKTRLISLSLSLPMRVSSVAGTWVGAMSNILYRNVSEPDLELILHFRQHGDGTLSGTAEVNWKIVVGSGAAYRSLGEFSLSGTFIRAKAVPLEFSFVEKEKRRLNFVGKLEGSQLSGKFVASAVADEGTWSARPKQ